MVRSASRTPPRLQTVRRVHYPSAGHPVAASAATALRQRAGASVTAAEERPDAGLRLDIAGGPWHDAADLPPALPPAWMWARVAEDGSGDLRASHPAFLYALVHLLADGRVEASDAELAEGVLVEPSFPFHRPLYDQTLTQTARTARDFDAEAYVERLARAGFTHLEVNGLAFHVPFEPGVPTEYYASFYSYCPGLNHFVESSLTRGLYPAAYLQANLNRVQKVAALGRKYGLEPGLLCFEPRSLPEPFFQRYPTLRGARIDHPFRSHLPRYTLAQDHPVARRHYAEMMRAMMAAVPDLAYLSVWSNDSGAGFEHTSSLYVGRNGGPYTIREWRDHDQIAEAAGHSALRWLRLMQEAAAETNPDFEVLLRIEPFKVEHETLIDGMGDGLGLEAPSLLVRGYDLPYAHPRYPEQASAAGTIFHTELAESERRLLEEHRARGVEPKLTYSVASAYNLEPLLGTPFPRMLHRKLMAMREAGVKAASAWGGLLHLEKTPYWPHPEVLRAAQFTPEVPVDEVLARAAAEYVGETEAADLVGAWGAVEEAVAHVPLIPLYSSFGFVWLRTWVRPLVPDIEAIPTEDRLYYERFLVSTANNPNINDLGRDVLFVLLTEDAARRTARQFDEHALPRAAKAVEHVERLLDAASADAPRRVFSDLRDRARALQCWATTQRNTCAWVAGVYGALGAETDAEREGYVRGLQEMIDLDLENTRRLLDLWEGGETETFLVSDVGETSFIYGENVGDLLRRKLDLTERYRDRAPRIDPDLMWRLP